LNKKIINAPILALPNLQNSFKIEMDSSDYAIGTMLMQGRKIMCYYYEKLSGAVLDYPMYDKIYFLWFRLLRNRNITWLVKETIIYTEQ